MNILFNALIRIVAWLGTVFLIRHGAKQEVRADQAEATIDEAARANAPITDADRERVREKYRRD